jgi:ParB family chromosome partitioning protein
LLRLLTSHRTSALAAEMMNQPKIAFAVLTQELVSSALNLYSPGLAKIHTQRPSLSDEVCASAAYAAVEAKREVLGELLKAREEGQSVLVWLLDQPMETLMELMAFSVACTLDAVQGDEAQSKQFDETAQALNLDMRKWWSATSDNYFNHVSKARAVQIVTLAVSPQAAVPLEKMKKGEAANAAERAVATARWLPDVLHTQAVAAAESDAGKLEPAGHAAGLAEQG